MNRRLVPLWISCILLLYSQAILAQESGLQTNAKSGIYKNDQRFWFSVPSQNRLVLSLDGKELFRGIGSASVLLSVPVGSEKSYTVVAQRRAAPPDNDVLEEKIFNITIDKEVPQKPVFSVTTQDGLSYQVSITCEKGTRLEGVYTVSDSVILLQHGEQDLPFTRTLAAPFSFIAWSVDGAGNCSEPLSFTAEQENFSIINPLPGTWQNPQQLVVKKHGKGEIYWTDDGSDPFGSAGHIYEKPILISKRGTVKLRIGIKLPNGLVYEKNMDYVVADQSTQNAFPVPESIDSTTTLNLEGNFEWAIAPGPWLQKELPIRLVPVQGIERYVQLLIKNSSGIYCYPILLDGGAPQNRGTGPAEGSVQGEARGGVVSAAVGAEQGPLVIETGAAQNQEATHGPELITAGELRVLYWKHTDLGPIRYRFSTDEGWKDYAAPIVLPKDSVTLEWLIDRGIVQDGPEKLTFAAQKGQAKNPRRLISYRSLYPGPGPYQNVGFYDAEGLPDFAACAGEDLEWSIRPSDGDTALLKRTDALPPQVPILSGPSDGAWVSGALTVKSTIPGNEPGVRAIIKADLKYPSGLVEHRQGEGELTLEVPKESPVVVSLSSFGLDEAGNQSLAVTRAFTIDANSVYVSNVGSSSGDGSRNQPVNSLELAMKLAKELGRSSIRIQDSVEVVTPLDVQPGISLESASNEKPAEIRLIGRGQLLMKAGTVALRRLTIRSEAAPSPAIRLIQGTLEMSNTTLSMKGAQLGAIVVTSGGLRLENCSINMDAKETANAIWAEDAAIELQNTVISIKAVQYANGVEMKRGTFQQNGGYISVAARDGSIWQFTNLEDAQVQKVHAELASDFVAQACVVEGTVPHVADSMLYFKGNANSASVFNFQTRDRTMVSADYKGFIRGNYFIGFSSLLNAPDIPMDIKVFNRIFASPDAPNFVDEVF
jgi:hypothetical protein